MTDALRLAVGTLTAVPVPAPSQVGRVTAGRAMLLAPLVGLVPGGLAAAVLLAARPAGLSALLAAALAVASLALSTRALHLDGLADTADGLTAGYDAQRALTIMRKGDVGPAGAAAVCLVLLVQTAALAQAGAGWGAAAVAIAAVAGRATLPMACRRGVPSARPEGLGALVAGSLSPAVAVAGAGLAVAVGTGLALLPGGPGLGAGTGAAARAAWAAGAVLGAVLAGSVVLRRAVRRLGGMTGDVLGACVEVGTATALVVLAASG